MKTLTRHSVTIFIPQNEIEDNLLDMIKIQEWKDYWVWSALDVGTPVGRPEMSVENQPIEGPPGVVITLTGLVIPND